MWKIIKFGCQGRISDGGVYRNSQFFEHLTQNRLKSTHPYWDSNLRQPKIPIVFVGDDAFPLSKHSMKPMGNKNKLKKPHF